MEQLEIKERSKVIDQGKIKLGSLVAISKGKKHPIVEEGIIRYLNIEDLHNPSNRTFTNDEGISVFENDLIIAWDGANAGKVGVGLAGVIGSTLARLRLNNGMVDSKFLYWFLESKNELIKSQRTGATIPHVNGSALKDLQIPIPPLETQKRIAAILDKADALRRKDQELLKKYDELAQAIFIDIFGDLSSNQYKTAPLSAISEVSNGVTKNEKLTNSEMVEAPYLRVANVQDGFLDLKEIKEIKVSELDFKKYQLKKWDILLTEGGDPDKLGRGTTWQEEVPNCIFQNHLFRVRINSNEIRPYFLSKLIASKYGKKYFLKAAKQTTGIATINSSQLKEFPVIIPPIKTQDNFEQKSLQLELIKKEFTKTANQSESLFQTLLQKAFKGELVLEVKSE